MCPCQPSQCGESYLPAGCQHLCLSHLSQLSSSRAELDRASIAITLASITLGPNLQDLQDARRQECLQEKGRQGREGRARRQEDGEDKSRSKTQEGEEAKGAKAKGCTQEKGDFFLSLFSTESLTKFSPPQVAAE